MWVEKGCPLRLHRAGIRFLNEHLSTDAGARGGRGGRPLSNEGRSGKLLDSRKMGKGRENVNEGMFRDTVFLWLIIGFL